MADLALVAGDFGSGGAGYRDGVFRLPGRRQRTAAGIATIEVSATVVERSATRALGSGLRTAAGLAPVAMIVGAFAFPLAAIGTVGIAAAAIGGALGLLGGGAEDKALVQVRFDDGTGFVAVCAKELVAQIERDRRLLEAFREPPAPALRNVTPPAALPPRLPAPAEPGVLEGTTALIATGAQSATEAVSAATEAVSAAATRAGEAASEAGSWIKGKLLGR